MIARTFAALSIALVCALFANVVLAQEANAGRFDFVIGPVRVLAADSTERAAEKGGTLVAGDSIVTGTGRAQIRFADGGYVSLLPDTTFTIREFRYGGRTDGTESAFFALPRGAIRAVTGWVGRVNTSRYGITTPTATIGVRGTGGLIEVAADGTTRIVATSGIWTLTNRAGTLAVPAGTAAIVTPNPLAAPARTAEAPVLAPTSIAAPTQLISNATQTFVAGDDRTRRGASDPLLGPAPIGLAEVSAPPLPSPPVAGGGGGAGAVGGGGAGGGNAGGGNAGGGNAGGGGANPPAPLASGTFAALVSYGIDAPPSPNGPVFNEMTSANAVAVDIANNGVTRIGAFSLAPGASNQVRDGGNNGVLAWGRWIGDVSDAVRAVTRGFDQQSGLHFVVGAPSGSLPSANPGGVAVVPYSLVERTSPTIAGRDTRIQAGNLASAALGVDFTSGRVGVELLAQFAGFQLDMRTAGGASAPAGSSVTIDRASATFSGALSSVQVIGARPVGFCESGCSGAVRGLFSGTDGAQAGLVYQVNSPPGGAGVASGAAVFAR